jgi:hypothetical protein
MKLGGGLGKIIKKKSAEKKSREDRVEELKAAYLRQISHLKAGLSWGKPKDISGKAFQLVRSFFCDFMEIKKSATFEEVAEKLAHKRIDEDVKNRSIVLLGSIPPYQYGKRRMSKERIKTLLQQLEDIINNI